MRQIESVSYDFMKLSKEIVALLIEKRGITQNQLAHKMGVCPGTLSNALNGSRGAGRVLLVGSLKIFPEESVESLTVRENSYKTHERG